MKQVLNDSDRAGLETRIRQTETETGVQIVMSVIGKSDNYPELPWKAFACGASAAGTALFLYGIAFPAWETRSTFLAAVTVLLGTAILMALLALLAPGFARLFLSRERMETETHQYAGSLFLSHELFKSEERRGVLIMVSRFERHVVILPDKGVSERLKPGSLENIISGMKEHLRKKEIKSAMEAGLALLVNALSPSAKPGGEHNELPDEFILEEGV
jgi:putative membrane protein